MGFVRERVALGSKAWVGYVITCLVVLLSGCGDAASTPATETTTTPDATLPGTSPTATTDQSGEEAGDDISSPCDIVVPELVESSFDGDVDRGIEGYAENCTYWIDDGIAQKIDVFNLGEASEWEDIRTRYEETRGGIVDVAGIGEGAFYAVDHNVRDLIFVTGDNVYSIVAFGGPTPEMLERIGTAVSELAIRISAGDS